MFYVGAAEAAPRSIPWDCSDWQETPAVADADDARVSMILESLAANRGKSIYCAIDQSDTWTKSETWLAGRDRNERDDTVYFGESGNFRGFLAAQEGYLTDGESGVTGISRDRIFEFPEEPRRGKKTVIKRKQLDNLRVSYPQWYTSNNASANPENNLINDDLNAPTLVEQVRRSFCQAHGTWDTGRTGGTYCTITGIDWAALAQPLAEGECSAIGYPRIRGAITSADIIDPGPPIQGDPGRGHWEYTHIRNQADTAWLLRGRQFRLYSVTCEKKVRVRRR